MQALIIGAAGMVGAKLAASLADDPAGITALRLVDVVPPRAPAGPHPRHHRHPRPHRRRTRSPPRSRSARR